MTFGRLLWRNLLYHWRGNLAVLLGVVVGTAVLSGALVVGDSQRGSLRDLALERLGWVDEALVAPRFFREALADDLRDAADHVCPALVLRGTVSTEAGGTGGLTPRRSRALARKVTVFGVDARFLPGVEGPWLPPQARSASDGTPRRWRSGLVGKSEEAIFLNATLARALGVTDGDPVTLHLQQQHNIPRETLLGRRGSDDVEQRLPLPARVLPDDAPGSRLALVPGPEAPRNAFVPLVLLQEALSSRPNQEGEVLRGRVNALLVGGPRGDLQEALARRLTLADWGLVLRPMEKSKELSLESRRLILEAGVGEAVRAAKLPSAPTLVNMADTIALTDADGKPVDIPYSVVAAVAVNDPDNPGELEKALRARVGELADDQIILTSWKGGPLRERRGVSPPVGTPVRVKYYQPDDGGRLELREKTFRLAAVLPLEGPLDDGGLVPQVRGITDRPPLRWEPPFPYDRDRMRKAGGNSFWLEHKTAPRGYVTLRTGEALWRSRFGDRTSYRLRGDRDEIERALRAHLDPRAGGLVFDPVKANALKASAGGTDFAMLFLGFSSFLILSALLLVGLLFRLSLDRRAAEVGVLVASGLRLGLVRRLLLAEGVVLAAVGALLGTGTAVWYGGLLLGRLRASWPGGLDAAALRTHVSPLSLAVGYLSAVLVSVLTIAWAVRALGRVPPRALVQGQTVDELTPSAGKGSRRSLWVGGLALAGAVACLAAGPFVHGHEARAGTFFGGGMLFLVAGLAGLAAWMRVPRAAVAGRGAAALARLSARNAARHPSRSLLTAGLLAAATFLLVGVEPFRRHPGEDYLRREGGSGGFALLAESDLPVFVDLNSDAGRAEVVGKLRTLWQDEKPPPSSSELDAREKKAARLLKGVTFVALRVRAGDDASCLNLYQPRRPQVVGVPDALIDEGGFSFSGLREKTDRPWELLRAPGPPIPVFGEQNTVVWMLGSGLGKVLEVPDGQGRPTEVRIDGLLHDSIFQSGLLMSERNFLSLYPDEQGHRLFLIRARPEEVGAVREMLTTALADLGFEVTPTAERLALFLAVENMYLSTFQALGGMGLLLGTLGLAVVLLRSVWERRGELALLRALGYRRGALGWLVLAENGLLLLLGLGLGTLAALAAVFPHLLGGGGKVAWAGLFGTLALALAVGLAASTAATATTVRASLIPAPRRSRGRAARRRNAFRLLRRSD